MQSLNTTEHVIVVTFIRCLCVEHTRKRYANAVAINKSFARRIHAEVVGLWRIVCAMLLRFCFIVTSWLKCLASQFSWFWVVLIFFLFSTSFPFYCAHVIWLVAHACSSSHVFDRLISRSNQRITQTYFDCWLKP